MAKKRIKKQSKRLLKEKHLQGKELDKDVKNKELANKEISDKEVSKEDLEKAKLEIEISKEEMEKLCPRKKLRCFPYLIGCLLSIILAILLPVATYVLSALYLKGNMVWYVSFGVFFGLLFMLFLSSLFLRKSASSFSIGLLFGLGFSLILIIITAAVIFLLLVWVGQSTQFRA